MTMGFNTKSNNIPTVYYAAKKLWKAHVKRNTLVKEEYRQLNRQPTQVLNKVGWVESRKRTAVT